MAPDCPAFAAVYALRLAHVSVLADLMPAGRNSLCSLKGRKCEMQPLVCSWEYVTESQRSWQRSESKLMRQRSMHLHWKQSAPGCNRNYIAAGGTDLTHYSQPDSHCPPLSIHVCNIASGLRPTSQDQRLHHMLCRGSHRPLTSCLTHGREAVTAKARMRMPTLQQFCVAPLGDCHPLDSQALGFLQKG